MYSSGKTADKRQERIFNLILRTILVLTILGLGFPGGSVGKNNVCQCRRCGFKRWQHTPVFWPGKSHGQRSLEDSSPWGHKELNTTEQLIDTGEENVD